MIPEHMKTRHHYAKLEHGAVDVDIGDYSYGYPHTVFSGSEYRPTFLSIGRYCSIAPDGHLKTGQLWPPQNGPVIAADF